jgi:flavodoxin
MSKAIVIYDSMFGNTEKIAKALARGLEKQGVSVDCKRVNEVKEADIVDYDFLALGGPTHVAGLSKPMKKFLETIEEADLKEKKGFCFDTRNHSRFNIFDLNSAAKRIERIMKKKQVKMIKQRESALVEGREGPLEQEAETRFERIGSELTGLILNQQER